MLELNPVQLLKWLESTVGRLMFKLFIYGCMLFAVIYALPIAMNKVDQIIEQFGGREIQDMKTEIAEIKARLGIEDMAECHDHDYTGRENA